MSWEFILADKQPPRQLDDPYNIDQVKEIIGTHTGHYNCRVWDALGNELFYVIWINPRTGKACHFEMDGENFVFDQAMGKPKRVIKYHQPPLVWKFKDKEHLKGESRWKK